jgi:competence protein ComEC
MVEEQRRQLGARSRAIAAVRPLARPILAPGLPGLRKLGTGLALDLAQEVGERRGFLWLPVAFAIGIGFYFGAAHEPSAMAASGLAVLLVALAFAARSRAIAFHLLAGLAAITAGFALATLHTARIAHPVLPTQLVAAEVSGFVERAELRTKDGKQNGRIVLRVTGLERAGEPRPERVRVTLPGSPPAVGSHVTVRATLGPPPGPAYPGGYDFGRDAWFDGIGATGFAFGKARESTAPEPVPPGLSFAAWLEQVRAAMAGRIEAVLSGDTGAIAVALVTGLRGGVSESVEEAMRISGLSHILSISGLHMALVAMNTYWLARALLALSPMLALRWPIKAMAALPAIGAATFYLVLSGNEVPTQRSYLMTLLVLGGIMLGRTAFTLRTIAIAALVVLIAAPATLLDPGTQMSFAATLALVAAHEAFGRRLMEMIGPKTNVVGKLLQWLAILLLTSLVAGLATAPYAAFHFQRLAPLSLLANLAAAPLVSMVIMLPALFAVLLMPLGWDGPIWRVVGFGIDGMTYIAATVAAMPGADRGLPVFPLATMILFSLALVCLCLLRTRLVLIAPLLAVAGLWIGASPERPDMLVDATGKTVAVRGLDGRLALMGDRPTAVLAGRFASEQWLAAEGDRAALTEPTARMAAPLCDRLGCTLPMTDGRSATLSLSRDSLADDCRLAAVLVTPFEPPEDCAAYVVRIAPDSTSGAQALHLTADGPQLVRGRPEGAERPWMPAPREKLASTTVKPARPITSIDPAGAADTQALPPEQAAPAPDQ